MALIRGLEDRLSQANVEYAAKRESRGLGPIRLAAACQPAPGSTGTAQRLLRNGGTLEQYKHPCLISDIEFRSSIGVLEEIGPF